MSWKEVYPRRFERPLDDIEIFFKTIADQGATFDREHWAVSIYAQFQCNMSSVDTELGLRTSWKTMRYDHPEIASFVVGNQKVYEVPSPTTLDSWMADTFHVEPFATADRLFSKSRPSPFPTLHYLPKTSEILIRSSHWRIDGIGALHLLNNFFRAFSQLRCVIFGNEWRNLTPGLSEAAKLSQSPTEKASEAVANLLRQYTGNLPSIGLPTQIEKQTPGGTRLTRLTIPPDTTLAILSSCGSQGYSVTTALHAALVAVTEHVAPRDAQLKRYTSWCSFNLRPYVQRRYSDSTHAVAVYLVGFPLTITPSTFANNTAQLKEIYSNFASPQSAFKFETCLTPYIKEATTLFSQPQSEDLPAPTEPVLNSVGVVDRYLQQQHGDAVAITDFWLATETLSRQLTVYVWTWQGRMVFSTCYNEEFYKEDTVKDLLERMRDMLLVELGINSGELV